MTDPTHGMLDKVAAMLGGPGGPGGPGGVIDLGGLRATWRERFFAVMMWEGRAPAPTEMHDSYADAVNAAKRHNPTPDVFEVKKITERVR